jgi:hypothetical protein
VESGEAKKHIVKKLQMIPNWEMVEDSNMEK